MVATLESITTELKQRCAMSNLVFRVPPDGAVNAQIAIVGEAPGGREVEMSRPFVGGSGNYLWDCLRAIGINRTQVYVTNVCKRQVSFATKGDFRDAINKAELTHWCGLMQWELSQLPNLQYVLALGNHALKALLGEEGITSWRGSVVETRINGRVVKVICANNPAMILREPKLSPMFRFDINKMKRVMEGKFNPTKVTFHINPTFDDAISWIRKMRTDGLPIGYDIETISQQTACHGLANRVDEGMCINLRDRLDNRFTLEQECLLYRELEALMGDESVQFVMQNGMFDCSWEYFKDRIRVHKVWFDTMLAHHTLYPQLPHNLGFIVTQYTDNPYYKDEGKLWKEGGDIDTFWRYNIKDCCHMLEAQRMMLTELRQQQLERFFFDNVMRRQAHLVRMTVMGCKADVDLKAKLNNDLGEDLNDTLDKFHKQAQLCTGKDSTFTPNPDSVPQVRMLLFTDMRLVGRGISVDKENRQRMRDHPHTNVEAKKLLDIYDRYKKDSKFLSTYVNMTIDKDNRFRTEYKQTGVSAAPGRLSSSTTAWNSGGNLQNIPQRAYPMFVADQGYELNYFDLAGAEARIVAHIANIEVWKEDFHKADTLGKDKYDVHRATASQVFGIPYDEVPSFDRFELGKNTDDPKLDGEPTLRFLGKKCKHGLNYRMQPQKLADTCEIPLVLASKAYAAYHRAYPEIRTWWDATLAEVKKTKCLWTPIGRRLMILTRLDNDEALESVIAFKPQSTIGDFVSDCIPLIESHPQFPKEYARVWMNNHDSLTILNRIGVGKQVRKVIREVASRPILINGTPVVIPTEMKVSKPDEFGVHRWSTMKPVVGE